MRIVIAEDSALFREGLARLLADAGHEVVDRVADAPPLLTAVRASQPDVAIVDIRLPPNHTDDGEGRHAVAYRSTVVLAATAGLSWLGLVVHNIAELPGQTPLSAESSVPALVVIALVLLLGWPPARPVATLLLLGWACLNLIGAVVTVLPIPVLPFEPAQTVGHYLLHFVYGLTQIPLLVTTTRAIRP